MHRKIGRGFYCKCCRWQDVSDCHDVELFLLFVSMTEDSLVLLWIVPSQLYAATEADTMHAIVECLYNFVLCVNHVYIYSIT